MASWPIIQKNENLSIAEVLEQYKHLYKIEHSFRSLKSHMETRPMFHWTEKRIEGHIFLCYITFALPNFTLQKVNATQPKLKEASIRISLDQMQVSLLQHNDEKAFIRSAQSTNEVTLQKAMGVQPLQPLVREDRLPM